MIEIYTDGSCNDRSGGWGALVVEASRRRFLSGRASDTTSNRMELTAAIRALESLPQGTEVTLYSDSKCLINTMTLGWKRNANLDLWQSLDNLVNEQRVRWEWVRGHAGNPGNEFADALAEFEAGGRKSRPRLERYLTSEATGETPREPLTHIDASGKARMVDVGWKPDTERMAVARGSVVMRPETLDLIKSGGFEKGDVIGVAQIAGIMGAKSTSGLIPLCHPLPLNQVSVEFEIDEDRSAVDVTATASTTGQDRGGDGGDDRREHSRFDHL